MSKRLWIPLVLSSGALALRAQDPADLSPRDKTEVFIQHLVKVAKVDPTRSKALVLEYEIGTALTELAHAHTHEGESAHPGEGHEEGDACCSKSAASAVETGNFIRSALRELHPEYAKAIDLASSGKLSEAKEAAKPLSLKADPYLAANASLLLAEVEHELALAGKDREGLARVIETCERIVQRDRLYIVDDHRACELIALAFAGLEKRLQEGLQYAILLTDYNFLPREVAARAKERLEALSDEAGRPLSTVGKWMNKVEKLLGEEKTGKEPTQAQEIEIVSGLDKLIELQEARERKT